jgi:alpha-glucoside transport system substrate-binding protein
MRRFRNLAVLLLVFALIAAACSSDDDGGGDTPDTTAATTTTAANPFAGTSVTVFGSESSDEEAGSQQDALAVFAAESGIVIRFTGARDFSDQINAQAAGGNPPDIGVFPQPGKVLDFGNQGFLVPVPSDLVASVAPAWPAGTNETVTTDAGTWGLMSKTDLKSLVWYNNAIFADGGYEVPTTLDDLVALSNQMIADGVTPWCVGIESGPATGWTFTDWMEDLTLRLEGADFYDDWVSNDIKFDDPRVIAIGDFIIDWWDTPGNTFAAGGSIAATAFGANGEPLAEGDCAMHRQASFFAAFLPDNTVVGPDGTVNVFYFPSADDTVPVLTAGTYVSSFRDAPEVWAVMEYMASAQYAEERQKSQSARKGGGQSGFLSSNLDQDMSVYNELETAFVGILLTADPARFDGGDMMPAAVGSGTFWTEGTSAVNGDSTVAEAFAVIQASWPDQ